MRVSGRPVRRVISSDALTVSDAPLTDLDLVRQIRLWYGAIEQADRPRRRIEVRRF
jgi:hypothetical protein